MFCGCPPEPATTTQSGIAEPSQMVLACADCGESSSDYGLMFVVALLIVALHVLLRGIRRAPILTLTSVLS